MPRRSIFPSRKESTSPLDPLDEVITGKNSTMKTLSVLDRISGFFCKPKPLHVGLVSLRRHGSTDSHVTDNHRYFTPCELRLSIEQAVAFVRMVPVNMCVIDLDGHIKGSSDKFNSLFNSCEITCKKIMTNLVRQQDYTRYLDCLKRMSQNTEDVIEIEEFFRTRSFGNVSMPAFVWNFRRERNQPFILATLLYGFTIYSLFL